MAEVLDECEFDPLGFVEVLKDWEWPPSLVLFKELQ
jgi:hypothetical protein